MIDIQLIVVNYRTYSLLQKFIDSYLQYRPSSSSDLMIVDVGSTEEMENIRTYGLQTVREYENIGYARACNWAGYLTRGVSRNLAFFNADTLFVNDTCVDICVQYLNDNPRVGIVGPLQYSTNGKITSGGAFGPFDNLKDRLFHSQKIDECRDTVQATSVSGSAFFTKRHLWEGLNGCPPFRQMYPSAIGGFPVVPHFWEETSYCFHAAQHGYDTVFVGAAEMVHLWHQSSSLGSQSENAKIGKKSFDEFRELHEQWAEANG